MPASADERDPTVPQLNQMFGRELHAEPEIGADMIVVAPSEAAQHLNHRNAETSQTLDDFRICAFGGAQQQPVDAMLTHPLDEAVLASRRFPGICEKRNPAGAIQRVVHPRGQFGVERVGDLADDEPDRIGMARTEIGGGAIVDIAERVDRGLHARSRRLCGERIVAQDERHRRRRNAGVLGDVLQRHARQHSRPAPALGRTI